MDKFIRRVLSHLHRHFIAFTDKSLYWKNRNLLDNPLYCCPFLDFLSFGYCQVKFYPQMKIFLWNGIQPQNQKLSGFYKFLHSDRFKKFELTFFNIGPVQVNP